MDSRQLKTIAMFGYSIEELPGKTIPKTTYYKVDKGVVIPMPNLPADPHNIARYLKRGFTLDIPKVEPPPTEPESEPVGFTCETCGKVVSTKLALAGHKRSHKN